MIKTDAIFVYWLVGMGAIVLIFVGVRFAYMTTEGSSSEDFATGEVVVPLEYEANPEASGQVEKMYDEICDLGDQYCNQELEEGI